MITTKCLGFQQDSKRWEQSHIKLVFFKFYLLWAAFRAALMLKWISKPKSRARLHPCRSRSLLFWCCKAVSTNWEMLRFRHSAGFRVIPAYSTAVLRPCLEYGDVFLVRCSKSQAALLEKVPNRALRIISRECTPAPQLYFPKTTTTEQALYDLLPQTRADSTHKPLLLLLIFFFFTHFYCRTLSRNSACWYAVKNRKEQMPNLRSCAFPWHIFHVRRCTWA